MQSTSVNTTKKCSLKVFKVHPNIKDGIYDVTNVGVEILKYVQIFILVGVAFILEGIQQSGLVMKKSTKHSKTDILMKSAKIQ